MLSLGETVVGSSDNLSKKILPFDRKMSDIYTEFVLKGDTECGWASSQCCIEWRHRNLENDFLNKQISIAFSVEDLLSACIKNTMFERNCETKVTSERCSEFVFEYVKYLVGNKKSGKKQDFGIPTSRIVKDVVEFDLANIPENIKSGDVKIGDKIVTHGYLPEQLPRDKFDLTKFFIKEHYYGCKGLEGKNGIKKVIPFGYSVEMAEARPKLAIDDLLLNDIKEFVVADCGIEECMDEYKKSGNQCVPKAEYVADVEQNKTNTLCEIGADEKEIAYKSWDSGWNVMFDTSVIVGKWFCSNTEGNVGRPGNPEIGKYDDAETPEEKAERNEKVHYCWCQVTSHKDSMNHDCGDTSGTLGFVRNMAGWSDCNIKCGEYCAKEFAKNYNGLRETLMGKNNPI